MKKLEVFVEAPLSYGLVGKPMVTADIESGLYEDSLNELKLVEVSSIEEAIDKFQQPIADCLWGASDMWFFESGFICLDGKPIARISYNCRVSDVIGKDIRELGSHEQIQPSDFNTYLENARA